MKPGMAPRRTSTAIAGLVLLALSLLSSVRPAAVYTLVHRPGGVVKWYEEGLVLRVPEGFALRQARYALSLALRRAPVKFYLTVPLQVFPVGRFCTGKGSAVAATSCTCLAILPTVFKLAGALPGPFG